MNSKLVMSAASLAVVGLIAAASVPAQASTLFRMDFPSLFDQVIIPYSLPFTAEGSSTTISIAGFDLPGGEQTTNIGLFLGGTGPNLLGPTWVFSFNCGFPPPCGLGFGSNTFNDGTSVPALSFFNASGLDTYSQTIPTKAGRSYSLDFRYTNDFDGLLVVTTPLPGTLSLFGSSLLAFGLIALGRRWTTGNTVTLLAAA
jgi:hypothetical protein